MSKAQKKLTTELRSDIKRIGLTSFQAWLKENDIQLPDASKNLYDAVEEALDSGSLSVKQLHHAIAEIEESGDKKIRLFKAKNFKLLEANKSKILTTLKKKGIAPSDENWVIAHVGNNKGILIYMFWNNDILKIKFGEKHFDNIADPETSSFTREEKQIRIIIWIDAKTGFTQLRLDTPGTIHGHKNDERKSSEPVYENYYVDLMKNLFPDLEFVDVDLNGVANHIEGKERDTFRLTKGVSTITQNAKQTFATAGRNTDVRDLPNYKGALAQGGAWRAEDLTGYWIAAASNGDLKKDLFMRISRKTAHIRVQRGCLEKELQYGITKIREIQGTV